MKSVIRIAATTLAPCVPFIVVVFLLLLVGMAEGYVRRLARKPIPVIIQDDVPAVITADIAPDFLWIGQAWRVNVDCDAPVRLDFNSDWTASLGVNVRVPWALRNFLQQSAKIPEWPSSFAHAGYGITTCSEQRCSVP